MNQSNPGALRDAPPTASLLSVSDAPGGVVQQPDGTTEHTPGPWLVDYYTDTGGFCVYVSDGSTATICSRGQWLHRKDESEANARLIAAAPDLLAALRMARALLVDVDGYEATGPSVLVIDAAIAKATERT